MKLFTLLLLLTVALLARLPAFGDASAQARRLWNTDRRSQRRQAIGAGRLTTATTIGFAGKRR